MPHETMTPRERWLAVLTRQKPDRVPMDYWATPEFSAKLIRHLGLSPKASETWSTISRSRPRITCSGPPKVMRPGARCSNSCTLTG